MDDEKQGAQPPSGETPPKEKLAPPPQSAIETGLENATMALTRGLSSLTGSGKGPPLVPGGGGDGGDGEDEEEQGMLRMSFMEHLDELRMRIIRCLMGLAVAFVASLVFAGKLWDIISEPAVEALKHLGVNPPHLVMTVPMEGFSIIWVKLPILCSIFLGSPWIVYQVWAFIAPGLYRRERRWAAPFVLITAGLFIAGGFFAYYLAFRFGLEFLLGIGMSNNVTPMVTITEYFDLFVNVTLGVGLVFELPVLIFLLTLLRVASPRFLIRHSRYAILAIVIIAAIVTPTPDVFNLMLFAVPMVLLYFVGVFAGYLLVLKREGKKFPWKRVLLIALAVVVVIAAIVYVLTAWFHLKMIPHWPFLTR
jgi:sec-independent protein translocase protein TatC